MHSGANGLLSQCIQQAGYGFTNPGHSFYNWDAKSFDPGPSGSQMLMQAFHDASSGSADEVSKVVFISRALDVLRAKHSALQTCCTSDVLHHRHVAFQTFCTFGTQHVVSQSNCIPEMYPYPACSCSCVTQPCTACFAAHCSLVPSHRCMCLGALQHHL